MVPEMEVGDSFEHQVVNAAITDRVVLLLQLTHPFYFTANTDYNPTEYGKREL